MMRLCKAFYRDDRGEKRQTDAWYVEFRDHRDAVRRIPAFTDKRASQAFGDKLQELVSLRIADASPDRELTRWVESLPDRIRTRLGEIGLLDADRVASTKPLADHLTDYESSLRDSGATPDYVRKTAFRIRTVLDGVGAAFLTDLSAARVSAYLAELRTKGREVKQPDGTTIRKCIGAKSSNHYLASLKSFANWLQQERRISENPLAHLSALNAKTDRKHVRRALDQNELQRLLTAARTGPMRFKVSGEDRYWLYRIAVETGLRSNELRTLTRSKFELAGERPTITVEAANAKNRKAATLPLRPDTATELRAFLSNKLPTAAVFKLPRPENIVVMLRRDLEAAGIPYRDETGRVADFHSLRGAFATMLLQFGVDVRTAKELMRHSTIAMTADVYACTFRETLHDAVRKLPSLAGNESQRMRAVVGGEKNLPENLPDLCARPCSTVQRRSMDRGRASSSQPITIIGGYDESKCNPTNEHVACATLEKLPPRGFEPLSPA
ncbi:MAG: site-specific integrase [Planctomycetes bacterium]|nr:site-specific integrase [Planctomycetota bacterium]